MRKSRVLLSAQNSGAQISVCQKNKEMKMIIEIKIRELKREREKAQKTWMAGWLNLLFIDQEPEAIGGH